MEVHQFRPSLPPPRLSVGVIGWLVDEFRKGAQDAGNDVFTFEAAWEAVGGCYGCDA